MKTDTGLTAALHQANAVHRALGDGLTTSSGRWRVSRKFAKHCEGGDHPLGHFLRAACGGHGSRIMMVAMLSIAGPIAARSQNADVLTALKEQVVQPYRQGKYKETTTIADKALALAEHTHEREHSSTLSSVNNLTTLYEAEGHYGEVEPLLKRALAGTERALRAGAIVTLYFPPKKLD